MNVLQEILSDQNGAIVRQLAGQFGLNEDQAQAAVKQLVPALAVGVKNNTARENGLESLVHALQKGNHTQYVTQPQVLREPATREDGNAILGHVFGSKEVSRRVAGKAAEQTGIGSDILKQMLPVLASVVMGTLSKSMSHSMSHQTQDQGGVLQGLIGMVGNSMRSPSSSNSSSASSSNNPLMGMITGFLDTDKDGSMMDDVLGMLTRSR